MSTQKVVIPAVTVRAEVRPGEWADLRFERSFRIGRKKDCDVAIDNTYVSRNHAEVVLENGNWSIRDLASANGLFVDGVRITTVPLGNWNVVRFGLEGPEV